MRRELIATVGADEHLVIVTREDGDRWTVLVDDREHTVDARMVRPGTWSLLIDGRSHVVDLDERKQGTVALANTVEAPVRIDDARRKRLADAVAARGGPAASGELVTAPIAGKVVTILVAAGDQVEAGQGVAVLEAMKMENEIKADRGGTVADIHVEPGQSVEATDRLVTLE